MKIEIPFLRNSRFFEGDKVVWMVLFFLCMISVIEVYSASSNMSYGGAFWKPILQHTCFLAMGVVATVLVHKIHCRYFKLIPIFGIPVSFFLLILVLFAGRINGGARWLSLFGLTFQPSELAKGALITTVAMILSIMRDEEGAKKNAFKWIMGFTIPICGLIVTENFSTAGIIFLVVLIMMFIGGIPWKQLGLLVTLLIVVGGSFFGFLKYAPMETISDIGKLPGMHRLVTWTNRIRSADEETVDASTYDLSKNPQVAHARIAIATSGLLGCGPGNSRERDFLPHSSSDFIYAIVIEELGLLGGTFVMFLYIVLLFRGAKIARQCERNFPAFLVMGIVIMLVVQAMVNMAVAVGAFPVTGQPLPLISKGGTSTMINCIYLGIVLSISRSAKKVQVLGGNVKQQEEIEAEPLQ